MTRYRIKVYENGIRENGRMLESCVVESEISPHVWCPIVLESTETRVICVCLNIEGCIVLTSKHLNYKSYPVPDPFLLRKWCRRLLGYYYIYLYPLKYDANER